MGWWQDLVDAGKTKEGPWSPSQAVVTGVKKLSGNGDMSWAGNSNYGVRGTPEQKIAEQKRNSMEQKTPSAAAARPTQAPEAPKAGFGIQGMNAGAGQGVAQFANDRRYEVQGDEVRRGDGTPMRGGVSYLPSAPAPQAAAQQQGYGAQPGIDPNALAQAQFDRIRNTADELLRTAGSWNSRTGLMLTDEDRAALRKGAADMYGQATGANNAGLTAGGGIAQQQIQAGAEAGRNASLRGYWDGKLGIERDELALKKQLASQKGAPDVKGIGGQVPYGRDKDGKPVFMDSGDYVQDGQVMPGLGRLGALDAAAGSAADRWGEDNSAWYKGLFGMNPTEEDIRARKLEEMQRMAPGYGVFR